MIAHCKKLGCADDKKAYLQFPAFVIEYIRGGVIAMWQFRYTEKIYKSRRTLCFLRAVDFVSVILCVAALLWTVAVQVARGSYLDAVYMLTYLSVTFIAVTLARKLINAKRPYELYDFGAKIRSKSGSSFPSRHVASAAAIATALMVEFIPLGIIAAVAAVLLSAVRVLLGLHFVRDVFAGAVIGVIGSLIGLAVF